MNYQLLSAELIRALRGRRSQAGFSRYLGYKSNSVNRWESQHAFPSAARFVGIVHKLQRDRPPLIQRFLPRVPESLISADPTSTAGVAAFLRELRGKTPILSIARETGLNRYSVSRWLNGLAEPRLPEFLQLIEAISHRLLDYVACCTDPAQVGSVAANWKRLQLAREAAYSMPWSHAVLRALELESGAQHSRAWLAKRLGLSLGEVADALSLLERTGQIKKVRGRWRVRQVLSVNTGQDPERAHALKIFWTEASLQRMRRAAPGNYGYSLFSISGSDMRRLRDLHLQYVRAMQSLIASSRPGECVGLYCAQLLDLATSENALDP